MRSMKHSIKREQSHARMSFAECENVRATLKHMKLSFHLILTLAAMLTMAQTAWATDPVTKTYAFSTRSLENNNSTLKMTDPDDNTSKTIITSASNYKFSNYGSDLQVGAGGQYTIYPNVNGKVTRVEFTHMGRWGSPYFPDPSQPVSYIGTFSMSITGMTCNGKTSLTGNGTSVGEGSIAYTNEDASFTFVSTDAAGIEGSLSMTLSDYALMLIRSGCELKITYIPSVAPVHAHDFTYTLDGNTLTATCGGTDGLACSLTNHQISTSLTADDAFDSDPAMSFPATLSNYAPFSTETGATKGNITYVNNTTSENLGTTMPSAPGQYTASITITAEGTGHTLTKSYNVYSYAQINNIYPQLNISTDKYASTTAVGANQTVTITFTSKFGETLTTLTVTGATTNMSIGSGITSIGNNKYTFTMPAEEVNIGATFSISEDDFTETGENEYTIKTANGWGWFCFATNYDLASDGFSGKTVKLATDVESAEIAGKSGHPFKGTFDGQNHTLTFNRTAAEDFCAPFHYINGATISNLHVQGTITGGTYENLGGLVGHSEGNITINNCRVSTEISTTVSGSALHGGVIGTWNGSYATCTVTGCVYDGLIYNPDVAGVTTSCHGFIGWDYGNYGTITFTDCLFAPAAYGTGKYALGDNCFTFVYPNSEPTLTYNMTNCYYTRNLGKRQGRPVTTATVAPANLGNAMTDHGMVDGYENGFLYDGNYYTPKYGDAVVEYRFNEWNERADVTINGTGNNLVGVNITEEVGNIKSVTYNRPFNTAQAATVILPFNYTCSDSEGSEGGKFYGFKEVAYDYDQHIWVCTMKEPGNTAVISLTANTPYLFMPSETKMTFPNITSMTGGVVTLLPTTANDGLYGGATTDYDWNFYGTYKGKTWTSSDSDKDYGFAAKSGEAVHGEAVVAGQFVRFTTGAFIKPMRCYLSYVGTEAPAPARRLTRAAATDDLPQSITVRLVSRSGETTAIGTLDTKTGELSFDSEAWYTLDGVRLSSKPSTKGIYINNGKKIVIK